MTRVAYLDCFSGISGDMLLGAMLAAGLPIEELRHELTKLPLEGYGISAKRVNRSGLAAVEAVVDVRDGQAPRTLVDVLGIIETSSLPAVDRETGASVFRRLAEAEATVHGETVETVYLHD